MILKRDELTMWPVGPQWRCDVQLLLHLPFPLLLVTNSDEEPPLFFNSMANKKEKKKKRK